MQKTSKLHQKSKLDFTIIMSHTTLQHSKRYSSASGMNTRPLILLFIFLSLTHSNVQCHLWPLHISLRSLNSWPLPFILSFSLSLFLYLPIFLFSLALSHNLPLSLSPSPPLSHVISLSLSLSLFFSLSLSVPLSLSLA